MSKSLNATKNRTTGNKSKSNFIAPLYRHGPERSPEAQTSRETDGDRVILPPRSHLESGVCAPKGDEYGRTPYRAEIPVGGPAAFGAAVGAERAFHGAAGDAPGEVAAHAVIVHVGKADPESEEPRVAQAREERAQIGHALDFLEPLIDIQAELLRSARAGEFQCPAARDARGHDPQIDAP